MKIVFWISLLLVFYTFAGYAIIVSVVYLIRKIFRKQKAEEMPEIAELPRVCMFTAAFNERDCVAMKVRNLLELDYPKDKIQFLWITDGSNDGTPDLLSQYSEMEVQHLPERKGKIHAMNRGMQFVDAPIVIFSDSNTTLNKEAVRVIVRTFQDAKVGCIAGEKRVIAHEAEGAAGSGENLYWKFESWVKRIDSELNTAIGAAGELFAIRKELFQEVENDTILDDFVISLRIAEQGYRIAYTPGAYAIETASANVSEEMKRKVRIAAGGLQTIGRLSELLNPFRFGWLSVQYISHKVLRWTLAPFALFLLVPLNFLLFLKDHSDGVYSFYSYFFFLQLALYVLALVGWILEQRKLRFKLLFVPYYFTSINYAAVLGWIRFLKGKQSVNWEKSKRA